MYERTKSTESAEDYELWPHTIQDGARRSGSRKNGRKKEITKVLHTLVKGILRSDGTLGINDRKTRTFSPPFVTRNREQLAVDGGGLTFWTKDQPTSPTTTTLPGYPLFRPTHHQ